MDFEKTITFKKALATTKRKNARFRRLTPKQQRIAIAKDVIAQVKAKTISPASMYFGFSDKLESKRPPGFDRDLDAGAVIAACSSPKDACQVCGIGSLFLSAVQHADRLTLLQLERIGRQSEVEYLARWFSNGQLDLVEMHYEQHMSECIGYCETPAKRLIMIMENIISNGGRFDPRKGKHRLLTELKETP